MTTLLIIPCHTIITLELTVLASVPLALHLVTIVPTIDSVTTVTDRVSHLNPATQLHGPLCTLPNAFPQEPKGLTEHVPLSSLRIIS